MSVATLVRRRSYGRLHLHRHRFDWDAQLYFNQLRLSAGIEVSTDDRVNVSAFCRGLKKLGYWNALVEGWTVRSGQNAGFGPTAYGLKGVKNALIVGAPTWGVNGITLDATTKAIALTAQTVFSGTSAWTVVLIFDYLGADVSRSLFCPAGTTAGQPNSIKVECSATSPLIRKHVAGIGTGITTAVAGAVGGFGYVVASRDTANNWLINQNGTTASGVDAVALAASADYNIGNTFSDGPATGDSQFAHVLIFNTGVDSFGQADGVVLNTLKLIDLCRNTISQGLGL